MNTETLAVRGVSHAYRSRRGWRSVAVPVLTGLDLELYAGEALGLIGESGSGKSTFARLACGLERPDNGEILLERRVLHEMPRLEQARGVQLVFQQPAGSFNPRRRIGSQLALPLRRLQGLSGERCTTAVHALLDEVGLPEDFARRWPHELSGGQLQRVAIARALAAEPKLLILDEPTSALDVSVQARVLHLLARLRAQRRMAMLFISHDLAVVRSVADRIAVLHAGSIVETRTADTLIAAPGHPYTRRLLAAVPRLALESEE